MAFTKESALRKDRANAGSTMEHRHFATIAAIIRDMGASAGVFENQREGIADHFATELARTNPRFDRRRFLAACGVEG